jgi:peptide deformylase
MAGEDRTLRELQTPTSEEADVEVEREQDAPEPAELDPETRARRDAALRHVRKFGDPVLRASALPVDRFDEDLRAEVERMGELMHDALGIGLAATQLGVLHRVLVYRAYSEDPLTALVNPVLEWTSEEQEVAEEGCLSLPGVHVEVERPARVRVQARDETGKELEIEAEGLDARVIQHEIDHLDGVLILDRIPREARKDAMRAMREAQVPIGSTAGSAGGGPASAA